MALHFNFLLVNSQEKRFHSSSPAARLRETVVFSNYRHDSNKYLIHSRLFVCFGKKACDAQFVFLPFFFKE